MLFARILAITLIGLGALVVARPVPAMAQGSAIDEAKGAGVIGERIDGYLGFVNDGPADASLRRAVQEINNKRRAVYDELASDTDTTTEQVARVTGEKQIERAAPGHFFMDDDGVWRQKS